MNKQDVIQIIKEFNITQGGTTGGFTVPFHHHNGSDMVQVASDTLIPYGIIMDLNINPLERAIVANTPAGTVTLFDYSQNYYTPPSGMLPGLTYYDWGLSTYLGNTNSELFSSLTQNSTKIWSDLHLADFYLSVSQVTPQTITAGSTETIIFDALPDGDTWFPQGAYDKTTGFFNTIQNKNGYIEVYNGFNSPTPYLITASVAVGPVTTVSTGDTVIITVSVDGIDVYSNLFSFTTASSTVVATLSTIMFTPITQNIKITLTNNSANDINTDVAGIGQFTYFKIKQLK